LSASDVCTADPAKLTASRETERHRTPLSCFTWNRRRRAPSDFYLALCQARMYVSRGTDLFHLNRTAPDPHYLVSRGTYVGEHHPISTTWPRPGSNVRFTWNGSVSPEQDGTEPHYLVSRGTDVGERHPISTWPSVRLECTFHVERICFT
jgi:hypothetical protein